MKKLAHYIKNLFPRKYQKEVKLWNDGYVKYVDHMGDDLRPLISARMSTANPTGVDVVKDDNLRKYLWRHKHTSVFEQCELVVEIQVPIFIARQLVRHRTFQLNEYSMRYSEPLHKYYIPTKEYIKGENLTNKQGSSGELDDDVIQMYILDAEIEAALNREKYEKYRQKGVAKERVRDFQPVSAYTRIMLKANLRNWCHFFMLRKGKGAQSEIQDLANEIYLIAKDLFPKCMWCFDEYTLYAQTFSRTSMNVIKRIIENATINDSVYEGLSGSELREFKESLGLE